VVSFDTPIAIVLLVSFAVRVFVFADCIPVLVLLHDFVIIYALLARSPLVLQAPVLVLNALSGVSVVVPLRVFAFDASLAVVPSVDQTSFDVSFDASGLVSVLVEFLGLAVNAVHAEAILRVPVFAVLVQVRLVSCNTVSVVVVEVLALNALLAESPIGFQAVV